MATILGLGPTDDLTGTNGAALEMDPAVLSATLSLGVAARLTDALQNARELLIELRNAGRVKRSRWVEVFEVLAQARNDLLPVLEHIGAFVDEPVAKAQEGDGAGDASAPSEVPAT